MTDSQRSVAPDRLPWLADEPSVKRKRNGRKSLAWALAATVILANISYWAGRHSLDRRGAPRQVIAGPGPGATVARPTAGAAQPPPAAIEAMPPVEITAQAPPASASDALAAMPKKVSVDGPHPDLATTKTIEAPAEASNTSDKAQPDTHSLWSAKTIEGADGKLVRLGRFKTESEALENWRGTLSKYPGMEDLPAIAVPLKSLRDGSVFYRLQVGTTSQAHSAVICQRVQKLHQSCTVIGLEAGTKDTGL